MKIRVPWRDIPKKHVSPSIWKKLCDAVGSPDSIATIRIPKPSPLYDQFVKWKLEEVR